MSKTELTIRYELLEDVVGVYRILKAGHTDTLEYPTLYDEDTGKLHICQGHGVYTLITKDMYRIIEPTQIKRIPRTRGSFLLKEEWSSMCSAHREYVVSCTSCTSGSWVNVYKNRLDHFIFNLKKRFFK